MSGITVPTLDEITGHTVMAKLRSLCKKFIGLAQEVDDKIDAPLEEAHLAVETANATLATAQESLEDAQSAVTTANSASATANEASESAQESAETVAGYDTRLTNIENAAVKTSGNQDVAGVKTFQSDMNVNGILTTTKFIRSYHRLINGYTVTPTEDATASDRWVPVYILDNSANYAVPQASFYVNFRYGGFALFTAYQGANGLSVNGIVCGRTVLPSNLVRISREGDLITVWFNITYNDGIRSDCISCYSSNTQGNFVSVTSILYGYNISSNGYTDENGIVHSFDAYAEMTS